MNYIRRQSGIFAPPAERLDEPWLEVTGPDPHYAYFDDGKGGTLKVRRVGGGDMATAMVLMQMLAADGPNVGATAAEVDLLPAQALPLISAIQFWYPGKTLKIYASGSIVTGAVPGNASLRLRYAGAPTTGVILADTGAIAMTASIATLFLWWFDIVLTCRAIGTAGSVFATGRGAGLTSVTPPVPFHMGSAGPTAPAAVAIDTTANTNAFRLTLLTSAAVAATSFITRNCTIETMN